LTILGHLSKQQQHDVSCNCSLHYFSVYYPLYLFLMPLHACKAIVRNRRKFPGFYEKFLFCNEAVGIESGGGLRTYGGEYENIKMYCSLMNFTKGIAPTGS